MELNKEQIRTMATIKLRQSVGLEERHLSFNDKLVINGLIENGLVYANNDKKIRYYITFKGIEELSKK